MQVLSGGEDGRRVILCVVLTALLLDNFLLTVVVPVIPGYLVSQEEVNNTAVTHHPPNTTAQTEEGLSDLKNQTDVTVWEAVLYNHENSKIGWLLASKALVQLLVNPFVGPLINRYGCNRVLMAGLLLLLVSSLLFAFGDNYPMLFTARAIHGLSSPCIAIAGLSVVAGLYTQDTHRSRAMGLALGGLAVGVILGYPFGGVSEYFLGKTATFLVITGLILCQICLQCRVVGNIEQQQVSMVGTSMSKLLRDPYILICAGVILVPEMSMAVIESTVPMWLIQTFHPPNWQLGTVFVPDSIGFWIACNLFGFISLTLGRWRCSIVALFCIGASLFCIPLVKSISQLIVPHFCIGLSLGMIDASLFPLMALLLDTRHEVDYGNVYAITQAAISLGFALGPIVGSVLVPTVGFNWLLRGVAILNFLCIPICLVLRNPPQTKEALNIMGSFSYSSNETQQGFTFNRLNEEEN